MAGFLCPSALLQAARAAAQIMRGKGRRLLGRLFLKSSRRTSPAQLGQGLPPRQGAARGAALRGLPSETAPSHRMVLDSGWMRSFQLKQLSQPPPACHLSIFASVHSSTHPFVHPQPCLCSPIPPQPPPIPPFLHPSMSPVIPPTLPSHPSIQAAFHPSRPKPHPLSSSKQAKPGCCPAWLFL